ncbi:MAG: hypothetical protein AB7K71_38460 [Polyangiaceae bacterium]
MRQLGLAFVVVGLSALSAGCTDPTIAKEQDSLGPEQAGVPRGPTHRPGQPCVHCHQSGGEGSPNFSIAGTIFQDKDRQLPIDGALVSLVDSNGDSWSVRTNCAGNFYVTESEWQPQFPVWSSVSWSDIHVDMETPIYRDGACAGCHDLKAGPDSPGHIYVSETPIAAPGGCR